jgi:hypothetical protein
MVEVPPPVVIPDLPILGHEESAAVVVEAGEREIGLHLFLINFGG